MAIEKTDFSPATNFELDHSASGVIYHDWSQASLANLFIRLLKTFWSNENNLTLISNLPKSFKKYTYADRITSKGKVSKGSLGIYLENVVDYTVDNPAPSIYIGVGEMSISSSDRYGFDDTIGTDCLLNSWRYAEVREATIRITAFDEDAYQSTTMAEMSYRFVLAIRRYLMEKMGFKEIRGISISRPQQHSYGTNSATATCYKTEVLIGLRYLLTYDNEMETQKISAIVMDPQFGLLGEEGEEKHSPCC